MIRGAVKKSVSRSCRWFYRKYEAAVKRWNNHKVNVAIRKGKGKFLTLSVADMFFLQVKDKELCRYDMIVRYLAVENYYEENDFGFDLYCKMQDARMGAGYGEKAVRQFKNLIQSYEENGYNDQSYIVADKDLKLIDGSHRMALALYHHIDKIRVLEINRAHPVDYSIDWFFLNGFTDEEIDLILAKGEQLVKQENQPFSCVIWDPACKLKDDIIKDLGYFGKVSSCKSYHFRPEEYDNIVRAVYAIDDIEKWKIDKKIEYMGDNACDAVEVELYYEDPVYRVKASSGMPLSSYGERIKKVIRDRYKPYIDNYFFDIICHIGDNYLQSEYMHKIFEPGIRFREILEILRPYQYALIKVDVPYMPIEFPDKIPVGKDVDILCDRDSFSNIKERLSDYARSYSDYDITIVDSPDMMRVRFEISKKLIFQIDCRCKYESIPDEFLGLALMSRHEEKGYFVLDKSFEAIIRRVAYEANPDNEYHREYYEKYKTDECVNMFENYMRGGINRELWTEFCDYLDATGIPHDQVCIVGSATLGILGIRKSRDLDFIVSSKYANLYSNDVAKVTRSGHIEKVRKNWCRNKNQVVFSDDEIIENSDLYFYYKGFKVVRLSLVVYKKCVCRRDKDLNDLELIRNYMAIGGILPSL